MKTQKRVLYTLSEIHIKTQEINLPLFLTNKSRTAFDLVRLPKTRTTSIIIAALSSSSNGIKTINKQFMQS